jgi:hypothetical protein
MHISLETIAELDFALLFLREQRKHRVQAFWHVGPVRECVSPAKGPSPTTHFHESENLYMLNLTDSQQCDVTVAFKDKKGNDAAVTGITFAVSDAALLSVVQDATDPTKAVVASVGPLGTGQVSCTATNPDGTSVVGTLDVTVVAGDAVSEIFSTGTPVEQP